MFPKIDVRTLTAKGIYTGEWSGTFPPGENWIDIPYVDFSGPLQATLHYDIFEDDSIDVRGEIRFTLKGLCSVCMAEAEQHFVCPVEATFAVDPQEEEYGYQRGVADLTEFLRDSVLFALPMKLLCGSCADEE